MRISYLTLIGNDDNIVLIEDGVLSMGKRFLEYLCGVFVFFILGFIILSGNNKSVVSTSNINSVKSLQAVHIVNKYNSIKEEKKNKEIPVYTSFNEAISVASESPVAFMGKLTAYGPDCPGCSGNSACPPRQNFKNGNIYFQDQDYGKVRVVAADRSIPCGSIVRISGINIYGEPILAIVMDRGGAVKGNHLDLLFSSQTNLEGFATSNNIKFELIRYGW